MRSVYIQIIPMSQQLRLHADCFKWANLDSFFLLAVMLIKTHIPNMVISATQVYVWAKKP